MTKTEKLSHYSVVFIAVLAVVVSIWQVRISQEHNKLTVRPYLDYFYGWSPKGFRLELSNQGFGPAIIKNIDYRFDGKSYKNWDEVLTAANLRDKRTNSYTYSSNSPFASGKEVEFLELDINQSEIGLLKTLSVIIYYESIYKEDFDLRIDF